MYQQITLIGYLGNDPEMRYANNNTPVTSFSLATSRSWNNANGERQEKTNWWRISVWNKPAETAAQYLHKGSKVLITGEIEEARIYTDRDGNPRSSIEVKAKEVRFLDSKGSSEGAHNEQHQATAATPAPAGKPVAAADIPF